MRKLRDINLTDRGNIMANNNFTNNFVAEGMKAFQAAAEQLPTFDLSDAMAIAQRNMDSATNAFQTLFASAQNISKRQTELFQKSAEEAFNALREIAAAKDPKASAQIQADFAKSALEQAAKNASEIAELASKSQNEVAGIVSKQVNANINDFSKVAAAAAKKPQDKKAA